MYVTQVIYKLTWENYKTTQNTFDPFCFTLCSPVFFEIIFVSLE